VTGPSLAEEDAMNDNDVSQVDYKTHILIGSAQMVT